MTGLCLAGVALLWLGLSLSFGAQQELWVDEVTQLSGLRLPPDAVLGWLAGEDTARFGVPGDRMPPASYWLGWLSTRLFGLDEGSMRVFGALFTLVGIVACMLAARRLAGLAGAVTCGLLLALSPALVVTGVEIRAYPIFFALSALGLLSATRILGCAGEVRPREWVALTSVCVAAVYTHFYGLVLSGALLVAILPSVRRARERARPWLVSAGTVGVSSLGILPFVLGASRLSAASASAPVEHPAPWREAARLVYRLLGGSPPMAVFPFLLALALGGMLVLLGVGVAAPGDRAGETTRRLALGAAAGLAVATVAQLAQSSFAALSTSYNVWLYPFVAVLAGAAVGASHARARRVAQVAAACVVLASAGGSGLLLRHPGLFSHSASERVETRVDALGGPGALAIVHDARGAWGMSYFPLVYLSGGRVRQYLGDADEAGSLSLYRLPDLERVDASILAGEPRLLLVGTAHQSTESLVLYARTGATPTITSTDLVRGLVARGYRPGDSETLMALASSEITPLFMVSMDDGTRRAPLGR